MGHSDHSEIWHLLCIILHMFVSIFLFFILETLHWCVHSTVTNIVHYSFRWGIINSRLSASYISWQFDPQKPPKTELYLPDMTVCDSLCCSWCFNHFCWNRNHNCNKFKCWQRWFSSNIIHGKWSCLSDHGLFTAATPCTFVLVNLIIIHKLYQNNLIIN